MGGNNIGCHLAQFQNKKKTCLSFFLFMDFSPFFWIDTITAEDDFLGIKWKYNSVLVAAVNMVLLSWRLSALESKTQPWTQRRCVVHVEPRRATLNKAWGKISIRRVAAFQQGGAFSLPHLEFMQEESVTVTLWQHLSPCIVLIFVCFFTSWSVD